MTFQISPLRNELADTNCILARRRHELILDHLRIDEHLRVANLHGVDRDSRTHHRAHEIKIDVGYTVGDNENVSTAELAFMRDVFNRCYECFLQYCPIALRRQMHDVAYETIVTRYVPSYISFANGKVEGAKEHRAKLTLVLCKKQIHDGFGQMYAVVLLHRRRCVEEDVDLLLAIVG